MPHLPILGLVEGRRLFTQVAAHLEANSTCNTELALICYANCDTDGENLNKDTVRMRRLAADRRIRTVASIMKKSSMRTFLTTRIRTYSLTIGC
jgi:hypothetical protein